MGRMKGVLLGMGVKEGARVTDGTMNGVDVTNSAAAMVCLCKAIDVLAIIVEIFICAVGVGIPFPRYLKKMIPRQQTEIATTIKPLTIYNEIDAGLVRRSPCAGSTLIFHRVH